MDNPELSTLRLMIQQARDLITDSPPLPQGRSARAEELLNAAMLLVDDLLTKPQPAAAMGKRGGEKTAERGPEYFKLIAGMRKTNGGGRPKKTNPNFKGPSVLIVQKG